jgi:hypothetical protein
VIGDLIARADTAKIAVPWLRTAYTHLTRGRIGDREIDGYCFSIDPRDLSDFHAMLARIKHGDFDINFGSNR